MRERGASREASLDAPADEAEAHFFNPDRLRLSPRTKGESGIASLDDEHRGKYSKWDESGVPTHDSGGEPLPKSRCKKLKTEFEKQKKLFGK